jgi:hypothetical protein
LWEQRTLAASGLVTQTVNIQHVNHAPTWNNVNEAIVTVVNSMPSYNFSYPSLMDDSDLNLHRVRVDLTVQHGRISLNIETLHLADFDFCNMRSYSAWQCTKDGVNKKRISFVAVPGDVSDILAGLSYEGFVAGNEDNLVMDVYDGVGGQCLDKREHEAWNNNWRTDSSSQASTVFRGCYHVQSSIKIPSTTISGESKSGGSKLLSYMNLDFKNFGSADIVFWAVFFAVCYCLYHLIRDCCPNCLARGARVQPDNHGSQDETQKAEVEIQAEIEVNETTPPTNADDLV